MEFSKLLPPSSKIKQDPTIIGWIEYVDLADIDLHEVKAKIDTGARTSALHAENITPFDRDGKQWVRFEVSPHNDAPYQTIEAPVHDIRSIKNTSGIPEERFVIRTKFGVADQSWPISVSLTDRSNMKFPMIVGRSALKRHNIAVHTRTAHLHQKKP